VTHRYIFVGEEPSALARSRGWTWRHGRLAAKQLFEALEQAGLDPQRQSYSNLFTQRDRPRYLRRLKQRAREGWRIVALGRKVERELVGAGVPHLALVHPAARGTIRRKQNYAEHCKRVLQATPRRRSP
jgi:hypothetical protein